MKTLVCDVCKRSIQEPLKDRNYFHIEHRDLCEPCKDQLEAHIKATMRSRHPFNYDWYERMIMESIEEAVSKGKF